eukprot:3874495-Rhodomonas_salina.1
MHQSQVTSAAQTQAGQSPYGKPDPAKPYSQGKGPVFAAHGRGDVMCAACAGVLDPDRKVGIPCERWLK